MSDKTITTRQITDGMKGDAEYEIRQAIQRLDELTKTAAEQRAMLVATLKSDEDGTSPAFYSGLNEKAPWPRSGMDGNYYIAGIAQQAERRMITAYQLLRHALIIEATLPEQEG